MKLLVEGNEVCVEAELKATGSIPDKKGDMWLTYESTGKKTIIGHNLKITCLNKEDSNA